WMFSCCAGWLRKENVSRSGRTASRWNPACCCTALFASAATWLWMASECCTTSAPPMPSPCAWPCAGPGLNTMKCGPQRTRTFKIQAGEKVMIETDYLVIGAGATGLIFADEMLAHSNANIVLVDRRFRPGGHWNDAYPFV